MKIKISFIISLYNADKFIDSRLRNLLVDHNEKDIEVVIIDSCSLGNEFSIIEKWQCMFPGKIIYKKQDQRTNYGISWLEGWRLSNASLISNANCDDLTNPYYTDLMYKRMLLHIYQLKQKIGFGYNGIHVVNTQGQTVASGFRRPFDRELMTRQCDTGPQICFRNDREFVSSLNWDLMYKRAQEYRSAFDYWLVLYLLSLNYDGLAIPDILTTYLQRADSIENSNKLENNYETYASISEFFPHHFNNHLKHAKEFADFTQLPPRDEWISCIQQGKKWL